MSEIRDLFRRQFSYLPTHIVRAPAAIELIGAGSGLRHGLALLAALDCHVEVACSPRTDAKCRLVSRGAAQPEIFRPDSFDRNPAAPWADFPKAVLRQLHKRKVGIGGFDAYILDLLPEGVGLDRCAALELAVALAVRALFPFQLALSGLSKAKPRSNAKAGLPSIPESEHWEIARLCQTAVREFLGVENRSLAPFVCLADKPWHLLGLDEPLSSRELLPFYGVVLVISRDSAVHGKPAVGEMNDLGKQLDSASKKLGLRSLRTAEPGLVKANRNRLEEREYECGSYAVAETARAVGAEHALRNNDVIQLGAFVNQSDEHLQSLFRFESCDVLLDIGRSHPACVGGRSLPGCFKAAVVHLVTHHRAEEFIKFLGEQYKARMHGEIRSYVHTPNASGGSP